VLLAYLFYSQSRKARVAREPSQINEGHRRSDESVNTDTVNNILTVSDAGGKPKVKIGKGKNTGKVNASINNSNENEKKESVEE
jgi:hypothetical protein